MSRENVDARPSLEAVRDAYLAANEAFNRHDFEAAFFGFHPDLEWHTVAAVPGPKVFHSRRDIIEAFRKLLEEFPDWRVEPQEFMREGRTASSSATGRRGPAKRAGYRYASRSRRCGPSGRDDR